MAASSTDTNRKERLTDYQKAIILKEMDGLLLFMAARPNTKALVCDECIEKVNKTKLQIPEKMEDYKKFILDEFEKFINNNTFTYKIASSIEVMFDCLIQKLVPSTRVCKHNFSDTGEIQIKREEIASLFTYDLYPCAAVDDESKCDIELYDEIYGDFDFELINKEICRGVFSAKTS